MTGWTPNKLLGEYVKTANVVLLSLLLIACANITKDYFPEWKELDPFEREWFSEQLRAAGEDPVKLPTENEVFRFTWLRSFHAPIVVRVNCDEKCILNAKQLSGAGGYSPGRVQLENRRVLTDKEMKELKALANRLEGWVYKPDEEIIGMDGAKWILETAKGDNYQAWNLWSPGGEKAAEIYVDMCLYMLNLTNFTMEKGNVY